MVSKNQEVQVQGSKTLRWNGEVECFKSHKKGHYANKCPEIKVKIENHPLKCENLKILDLNLIHKLNLSEFAIRMSRNKILIR